MNTADLLVMALARELAEAVVEGGVRVFAVTSPATVAAALAARRLGAGEFAIAGGFTTLDVAPSPWVSPDERGMLAHDPVIRHPISDTFALLARGAVGVATTPAQLDATGRTNLSGIGPPGRPRVALPGPRGLPDNNHSPSRVWYLFGSHSARTLVERVDMVCGAVPPATAERRLLTPAGCFALSSDGWRARWLTPDGPELVSGVPALGVRLTGDEATVAGPDPDALAAVEASDPHGVRHVEFAGPKEQPTLWMEAARRESRPGERVPA